MLADVLAACLAAGEVVLVSDDAGARELAVEVGAGTLSDPGEGQGAAVARALAELEPGPVLVVNADLPCVVPRDLGALLSATPAGGIALAPARDGTTNALSLPAPHAFAPLYGRGSAERFRTHAARLGVAAALVSIPNLRDDVDTLADLQRLRLRAGPRTRAAMATVGLAA